MLGSWYWLQDNPAGQILANIGVSGALFLLYCWGTNFASGGRQKAEGGAKKVPDLFFKGHKKC